MLWRNLSNVKLSLRLLVHHSSFVNLVKQRLSKEFGMGHVQGILIICVRIQSELVALIFLDRFEVQTLVLCRQELLMHNFKSITNSVVFSLERSKTGQDRVVNPFHKDHLLERVIILYLLILLVPSGNCLVACLPSWSSLSCPCCCKVIQIVLDSRLLFS